MVEKKKVRKPFYKRKTNYGIGLVLIAGLMAAFPPTTLLFSVGSLAITTHVASGILMYIGNALGVYGIADRISKTSENK